MAGKSSDARNLGNPFGWNFLPHIYSGARDAQTFGNLGHKAPFSPKQRNAGWFHTPMLSTTERVLSTENLQDGLALAKAILPSMDISNRIKIGRASLDMSQRALAKKVGVSPSAVAQWETGGTLPSISNRVDLARILQIPFIELVPEAGTISERALKDPLILAIVQQALRLPEPVREALLMQLSATAEALSSSVPMDDTQVA